MHLEVDKGILPPLAPQKYMECKSGPRSNDSLCREMRGGGVSRKGAVNDPRDF